MTTEELIRTAPNLLIEASAGTGKTQALAERLIALLEGGVKPQEIVALTFSRMAAGEIFERFLSLLASRAETDPAKAAMLRDVIATQHLSQIGTLDSFLMKIVRSFPLELGLVGDLEMMDDYQAKKELTRTSFTILRRTDAATKRAFIEAFSLAMNRENVRSFVESYRRFISTWHRHVLALPAPEAWGDPTAIWPDPPCDLTTTERDLATAADALAAVGGEDKLVKGFADWVRAFRGAIGKPSGLAKLLFALDDPFAGATIDVMYSRKVRSYGGDQVRAIRSALGAVCGYVLRQRLELMRGVHALIAPFEAEYDKRVRTRGRLVFDDVPRLIAALDDTHRLALEYRMDAKIAAWALDEFQDTSREQWKALAPLVEEAKQSDGAKSVFIVGDRKQAIYGWREGDVGIFTREAASGAYASGELNRTWRSGRAVVDAVNRLFAGGSVSEAFPLWTSPVHESARSELGGFVQRVEAAGSKLEDFIEPVYQALKAVDPVARGISAAVLVRGNDLGELLAGELRARGLEGVVWEGETCVGETPALLGFLDLVALADHPGDRQAYRHFVTTPLAKAKFPGGVPEAEELSVRAARAFTSRGLVRVFRELRALLPEDPSAAWSPFVEDRFTEMLRAASEFELLRESGVQLSDFAAYLAGKTKRNVAEPGRIKILSIHRSKGLGFDYVVLPLYEHRGVDAKTNRKPLVGDGWILNDPGAPIAKIVPGLREAWTRRQEREEVETLCVYYVAMTRAKRAMTIVTQPEAEKSSSVRFSDLVRAALPEEDGDREWYLKMSSEVKGSPDPVSAPDASSEDAAFVRGPRVHLARRLPSLRLHSGISAGDLFAYESSGAAARQRGTDAHAVYEAIAWIDPAAPRDAREREILSGAWRAAFVKPSPEATLWRERSFEQIVDGRWTSGQFDRVVFTGTGPDRRATVYDFKTNAKRRQEGDAAFAERLCATYRDQMTAYRAALARLTGLPLERVATVLLAEATHQACVLHPFADATSEGMTRERSTR